MIDHDIAGHDRFAAVGFRAIHALLAKAFNRFAQDVDGFGRRVTSTLLFNELFNFACNNQYVSHFISSTIGFDLKHTLISK
jgi:hypothetical protein